MSQYCEISSLYVPSRERYVAEKYVERATCDYCKRDQKLPDDGGCVSCGAPLKRVVARSLYGLTINSVCL
jgi:rRNA maturation endonuclease Nob1